MSSELMLGLIMVGVFIAIGAPVFFIAKGFEKQKRASKDKYFELLERISHDPENKSLKIEVLEAGRLFYTLNPPSFGTGWAAVTDIMDSAGKELRIQADIDARVGNKKAS